MFESSSKKIQDKDVTFVVQGPIIHEECFTKNSCKSIRKYFPDSKILLSTWKNSNTENLEYDEKIESIDPGAKEYYFINKKVPNNINRQITSSYNGIKIVKTKFAVKIRSDMYFKSNKLLYFLNSINSSKSLYSKKKIIIPSNMAINPEREYKLLFHPSDAFFAGFTEDIFNLFNIPLMDKDCMTYFKNHKDDIDNNLQILARYTCEQYLFYKFIRKKNKINFNHAFDFSDENKILHDKIFSDLFVCLKNTRIGVNCYKYPMSFFSSTSYYSYTENEFKKLNNDQNFIDYERIFPI